MFTPMHLHPSHTNHSQLCAPLLALAAPRSPWFHGLAKAECFTNSVQLTSALQPMPARAFGVPAKLGLTRQPLRLRFRFLLALAWGSSAGLLMPAHAEVVNVAVAANFAGPAKQLAAQFAQTTGHEAKLMVGATGQLYSQITQGAPFDVFLSADTATPERLQREQRTVAGSLRVYARGELVLWSAQHLPEASKPSLSAVLQAPETRHIAIASPKLAPYGAAAQTVLTQLGLWHEVQPKLVTGESVGKTFQFVATGNARVGFVARSQVLELQDRIPGTVWAMPAGTPLIAQALVQLQRSADNPAAAAWLAFLQSPAAKMQIRRSGYQVD